MEYNHKYLRDWAKNQGIPMPQHVMINPLEREGVGAYYVIVFNIAPGYESRVAYIEQLCATVRRNNFYARITDHSNIATSVLIDFVGVMAELDIDTLEKLFPEDVDTD